jgi:hypothetical protein
MGPIQSRVPTVFSQHHHRVYPPPSLVTVGGVFAKPIVDQWWPVFPKIFSLKTFNLDVVRRCVRVSSFNGEPKFYEWTLRLEGFQAGQCLQIYNPKDNGYSLKGSQNHIIEERHARGEDWVIREPANIFVSSKDDYRFWYALVLRSCEH